MKTSPAAVLLALAALGNSFPAPKVAISAPQVTAASRRKKPAPPKLSRQTRRQLDEQDEAIRLHNRQVDIAKREKWHRQMENRNVYTRSTPPAARLMRTVRGATDIRQLLAMYQAHSAAIRLPLTLQHKAEFPRRTAGRLQHGVIREAMQAAYVNGDPAKGDKRGKFRNRISDRVGGRCGKVCVDLANLQHQHYEEVRQQSWEAWSQTDSPNIWYNASLDVYMFSDETGDLFDFDPTSLCFISIESAESALRAYISYLNSDLTEEDMRKTLEQYGIRAFPSTVENTTDDVLPFVVDEEEDDNWLADDEVYALSGEQQTCDHVLYQDGDADVPERIQDRNGQVALSMCKKCGAAESELHVTWEHKKEGKEDHE